MSAKLIEQFDSQEYNVWQHSEVFPVAKLSMHSVTVAQSAIFSVSLSIDRVDHSLSARCLCIPTYVSNASMFARMCNSGRIPK